MGISLKYIVRMGRSKDVEMYLIVQGEGSKSMIPTAFGILHHGQAPIIDSD